MFEVLSIQEEGLYCSPKGNAEGEKVADTSPLLVEAAMVEEEEVDSQKKDATVM